MSDDSGIGTTQQFSHLHVHSEYSRIDGLGTVEHLLDEAKRLSFSSLALTDHGTMAGVISFVSQCIQHGVKPIIGLEGYVEVDGKIGHITLLGDGNKGMESLIRLNNIGHRSPHQRPAFKIDDLISNSDDVYCLTGCIASPLNSMDYPEAKRLAMRLQSAMPGRVFAELMFVSDTAHYERAAQLSKDLKLPPITTNDVHFARSEYDEVHTVLTNLKAGFEYNSKNLFMATDTQISKRAAIFGSEAEDWAKRGIQNAWRLSNKLKPVQFDGTPTLPEIKDADKKLWYAAKDGIKRFAHSPTEKSEMLARMKYEFGVIQSMGFSTYFLILQDLVEYAKRIGVRVGPGRGSGAGCLILYLLGITEINPLKFNLSFERFLNPKRKGMPDVDMDFDSDGRGLVIAYAEKQWEAYPVVTYQRYMHASLVHELCKSFKLDRTLDEKAADEGPESAAFLDLCTQSPLFEKSYNVMLGQVKHAGKHAGGVIITSMVVPLERSHGAGSETVAAWTEGANQELTTAGVVKYDILGLTTLSLLKMLEDKYEFRAPDLDVSDPVFDIFKRGDTVGIFQFTGSQGIVDYTKKVAPEIFEDLVAINALYRPGALDAGTAYHYPTWKSAPRTIHPLVDPVLAPTYGVIVYQEQVMGIYAALTDGDLSSADMARKTISKIKGNMADWELALAELKKKFFDGAKEKKVPDDVVSMLWTEILTHTRYSFNRSHSVAYAKVAADCAWWKYHHPADFYAALLTVDPSDAQRYIIAALSSGIEFIPPNVNLSQANEFVVESGKIVLPLSIVKYLGYAGAQHIIEARKAGDFTTYTDFMTRCLKKVVRANARLGMLEIGAFDGMTGDREDLQVKDCELTTEVEKQQKYIGFVLPSKALIDRIQSIIDAGVAGQTAGIIIGELAKKSNYGEYTVYYMMPTGTIWKRHKDGELPQVGYAIKAKIAKNSKLLDWKRL